MKERHHHYRPMRKSLAQSMEQPREGAWKLAYADFVTAMMCFFMLMWLLNATPSEKLKSMAMYFKPTIAFFNHSVNGQTSQDANNKNQIDSSENSRYQTNSQSELLTSMQLKINTEFASDISTRDLVDSIATQMNGDGIEISIFDNNTQPMFKKGSTELTEGAKIILTKIAKSITYLPNRIIIGGHTEKMNSNSVEGYTGLDLSAGRASNAMKVMQVHGLPEEKVTKLVAYGDNVPLDSQNPYAEKNSRITITVLTKWSTVDYKTPISKSALALDE